MRNIPVLILYSLFLLAFSAKVSAQEMQAENFILEIEPYSNDPTPESTPGPKTKTITPPSPSYASQEILNAGLFLNPTFIDFGIISPTLSTNRSLELKPQGNTEIILYTYMNHSLQKENGDSIPDASCDNGACSALVAGEWKNTLGYGLGYTCTGESCDTDFANNRFRPFSLKPTAFSSYLQSEGLDTKLTLRVNASAAQPPGLYENSVNIVAVPGL